MAYVSQELKAKLKAEIEKVIPADWKWSLSVNHHSTLVLTIREATIDLIGHSLKVSQGQRPLRPEYISVNEYYLEQTWEGKTLKLMNAIKAAMNTGNWDKSDAQTDYFNVGWYISIKIGAYQKPFVYNPLRKAKKKSVKRVACAPAVTTVGELTYDELKAKVAALEAQLR